MRVLFVYPNITKTKSPQLGLCMIAGVARDLGHECDLYDVTTVPKGEEISAFQARLKRFQPDIIAVSCRSSEWEYLTELFQSTDTGSTLKVFGGPHATVAPEQAIDLADVAVIGEGEETLAEILNRLEKGDDLADVAGCWVKNNGKIHKNPIRNLIHELDQLPEPNWQIFDSVHYTESYLRYLDSFKLAFSSDISTIGVFEKTRGCPYACSYCTNDYIRSLYEGKGVWRREKSTLKMIAEIKSFRDQFGLDCIYWIDEVILTRIDRIREFSDAYKKEIDRPFIFMERPENMTDKKVRLIKEAGASLVSIGIESGDEQMRRGLLNRKHSQQTIIDAFQNANKHGITSHAFTMIGFPDEDRSSIVETYGLLNKARPDTVQTTIFYPLRKTKLFDRVVSDGLFSPNAPMPPNYYDGSSLAFPKKKQKQLLRDQYLLSHYRSKVIYLLVQLHAPRSLLRAYIYLQKIGRRIKTKGLADTLRAIWKRLTRQR